MDWVKLPHERPCETCGATEHRWVRLTSHGGRIAEVTCCPVCSPEVNAVIEPPKANRSGSDVLYPANDPSDAGQESTTSR
jgi:hypothetical protein